MSCSTVAQIMVCGINTEDFNNRKLGLRNLLATHFPAIKKGREHLLEAPPWCLESVLLKITVIIVEMKRNIYIYIYIYIIVTLIIAF